MRIVIAGATGLVGREVLNLLLQDTQFEKVIVYSRRPLDKNHPRLRVILGELDELKSHEEVLQGEIFICCLGTTIKTAGSKENFRKVDFDGIVSFAEIAKKNEAKKFILISAQGANPDSLFFYPRVKGETERELRNLSLPALTIMRPSLLVGDRNEKRGAEGLAIKAYEKLSLILPNSLMKRMGTEVSRLATEIVKEANVFFPGTKIRSPEEI